MTISSLLHSLVGIKTFRCIAMGVMILILLSKCQGENDFRGKITDKMSTPRLERVLMRALDNHQRDKLKRSWLSSEIDRASEEEY